MQTVIKDTINIEDASKRLRFLHELEIHVLHSYMPFRLAFLFDTAGFYAGSFSTGYEHMQDVAIIFGWSFSLMLPSLSKNSKFTDFKFSGMQQGSGAAVAS